MRLCFATPAFFSWVNGWIFLSCWSMNRWLIWWLTGRTSRWNVGSMSLCNNMLVFVSSSVYKFCIYSYLSCLLVYPVFDALTLYGFLGGQPTSNSCFFFCSPVHLSFRSFFSVSQLLKLPI